MSPCGVWGGVHATDNSPASATTDLLVIEVDWGVGRLNAEGERKKPLGTQHVKGKL